MSYIITISRVNASGGKTIAERLASQLGIACYDTDELLPDGIENPTYQELFAYHTKILNEKADSGESFVLVGRVGNVILSGRENVARIAFRVPYEDALQICMNTRNKTYDEAVQVVNGYNAERDAYYHAVFQRHWEDTVEYDLAINSAALDWDNCIELIKQYTTLKLGNVLS